MPPGICDSTRDSEYMSAMLMSWYMSGYYTGLYHGRREVMQEASATNKQPEIEKTGKDDQKFECKRQRKRNIDKR
jgi:Survival motor neuron protein (SMN)